MVPFEQLHQVISYERKKKNTYLALKSPEQAQNNCNTFLVENCNTFTVEVSALLHYLLSH